MLGTNHTTAAISASILLGAAAARARLHAFGSTAHTEAFPHIAQGAFVIIGSLLTGCYILLVKKSVTTGYG